MLWSEGGEALRCERIFGGQGNVSDGPKLQNNLSVATFQYNLCDHLRKRSGRFHFLYTLYYGTVQLVLKEMQAPSKQLVTYLWIRKYSTSKCLLGDCSVGTSRCSAVRLQLQAISMCFTEASGSSSSAKRSADQRTCKLVNKTKCKLDIIWLPLSCFILLDPVCFDGLMAYVVLRKAPSSSIVSFRAQTAGCFCGVFVCPGMSLACIMEKQQKVRGQVAESQQHNKCYTVLRPFR